MIDINGPVIKITYRGTDTENEVYEIVLKTLEATLHALPNDPVKLEALYRILKDASAQVYNQRQLALGRSLAPIPTDDRPFVKEAI